MTGVQAGAGGGSSSSPRPTLANLFGVAVTTAWWALVVYPEIIVAVVATLVAR